MMNMIEMHRKKDEIKQMLEIKYGAAAMNLFDAMEGELGDLVWTNSLDTETSISIMMGAMRMKMQEYMIGDWTRSPDHRYELPEDLRQVLDQFADFLKLACSGKTLSFGPQ
jgi:hypothetical protein